MEKPSSSANQPAPGLTAEMVESCRAQFPALQRQIEGRHAIYLDGPAGTQVPQRVIDAVSEYLAHHNANHGGLFATSRESDVLLDAAHQAVADLLGAPDPEGVTFGPNMTTLVFALSRALARRWQPGDEIVVTRLEHDANFTPWVLAAEDAGVTVQYADIDTETCTLNMDDLRSKLSSRTRLVAVCCASNATGSMAPIEQVCALAREAGAFSFVDAVHYAPHALIDVAQIGCDFLACSAYKFFGPHVGVLWGRTELLERLTPYKLRPATNQLPGKWMTGTQNHEGMVGTAAAVEYLANLGRMVAGPPPAGQRERSRREALCDAFAAIRAYEQHLTRQLLTGMSQLPELRVWGIRDPQRTMDRMPTVSFTHAHKTPAQIAAYLGDRGIFVWHGNYYALPVTERLGLEPAGMVRVGMVHYNTPAEVERLVEELSRV